MKQRAVQFIALVAWSIAAVANAGVGPKGGEFRVSRSHDGFLRNPAVAAQATGESLIVWENPKRGLRAQFFGADGAVVGAERTLAGNRGLGGRYEGIVIERREPAVAYLGNGEFLLAWTEEESLLRSAPFYEHREIRSQDILAQRFARNGAPMGAPVRVSSDSGDFHHGARLAARGNRAVIAWTASAEANAAGAISARRLTGSQPQGAVLELSVGPSADHASVAMAPSGGFAVAWDERSGGELEDVYVQLFDNAGVALGNAARSHLSAAGRQRMPALAADGDEAYVLAWQSYLTDATRVGIFAARVDAAGAGAQFQLVGDQSAHLAPAIAATGTGTFVATWMSREGEHYNRGLNGIEFLSSGALVGAEFRITDGPIEKNYRRSIAAGNTIVVPWDHPLRRGQGISARRLSR